ncbi:MAG: DUF4238 domain-containing protein [Bacteroidota bacterium]
MKIIKISWRHHYLPEFYLKGFTNQEGKFKIYDKRNLKFIKNGKDFAPSAYFFEKNGNTITDIDEGESDELERVYYKKYDDCFSEILNNIKKRGIHNLTQSELTKVLLCIAILFWRGSHGNEKIKNFRLKDFYHLTINKNTGVEINDSEFEKWLINNSNAQKYLKLTIPIVSSQDIFLNNKPINLRVFEIGELPSLCSDTPIIFLNEKQSNPYIDNFIFPLTNNVILFHGDMKKEFEGIVKFEIDLILLKQAIKYVSCTDTNYIHILNQYSEDNNIVLDELKMTVFKKLFN